MKFLQQGLNEKGPQKHSVTKARHEGHILPDLTSGRAQNRLLHGERKWTGGCQGPVGTERRLTVPLSWVRRGLWH